MNTIGIIMNHHDCYRDHFQDHHYYHHH
jgi:hypothetical protein